MNSLKNRVVPTGSEKAAAGPLKKDANFMQWQGVNRRRAELDKEGCDLQLARAMNSAPLI
jgi:hypothetical protein